MADSFTETTNTSWFSRIGNSFKGIAVGFCLFIAAFPLLFWNEGRTIKQTRSLNQTEAEIVSANCDEVNQDNDGKPVYMTGDAKTEEVLNDDIFPVSVNGFKLKRNVEMYQWVEHEKSETKQKLGGGEETVTTYNYTKEWCDHPINSGQFKLPAEHENPGWEFEGGEVSARASNCTIGVFTLSESIVGQMNWYEPVPAAPETPSVPETPTAAPETPAPAAAPEAPSVPETPAAAPEAPALPELPDLPELPAEAPEVPELPALPELPDAEPEVPELPALPSETTADEAAPVEPVAPVAEPNAPSVTQTTLPAAQTTLPATQTPEAIAAANGVPEGFIYYKDGFYKGDPKKLSIGDVRVSFEYVPTPIKISVISGQQGDTFAPYQTKENAIELVAKGVKSSEEMFKDAHRANSIWCWVLRLIGFMMMFMGLKMVFEPLKVIADVVPFIGSIIGMGTGFVAFVLAAGFSLLTIAIGWVFYRPWIGIPLLIVAVALLLWPFFKRKKVEPQPEKAPEPEQTFEKL